MIWPGEPNRPTTEPISKTRPNRCLIMDLVARFRTLKTPFKFVSMTCSKSSSLMRSSNVSFVIPALATSTSIGPRFLSTSSIAASKDSASRTSALTAREPSGPEPERTVTATL